MGIGNRIKEARERKELTQKELAQLIGVTPSAITNYENEVSHPKEPIMYKLFDALEVDANFLFQDEMTQKEKPTAQGDELSDLTDLQKKVFLSMQKLTPEQLQAVLAVIKEMQ